MQELYSAHDQIDSNVCIEKHIYNMTTTMGYSLCICMPMTTELPAACFCCCCLFLVKKLFIVVVPSFSSSFFFRPMIVVVICIITLIAGFLRQVSSFALCVLLRKLTNVSDRIEMSHPNEQKKTCVPKC